MHAVVNLELNTPSTPALPEDMDGYAICVWDSGTPLYFGMWDIPDALEATSRALRAAAVVKRNTTEQITEPMELPTLTVAVCTHNRSVRLQRCLESLVPQRDRDDIQQILVVDNAPDTHDTRQVAMKARVDYAREPVKGLNFARNRALSEARCDWVAYLDDDVVASPRWAIAVRRAAAHAVGNGAVTGQILPFALDTPAQLAFERRGGFRRGFRTLDFSACCNRGLLFPVQAGRFGNGANMSFRRSLLLDLGGFDVALDAGARLPGGGDLDMFCRVIASGATLRYEPAALVYHEHRRDWAGLRRQYADSWGKAHMAYVQKLVRYGPYRLRALLYGLWWPAHELKQILKAAAGRHAIPAGMLWAELMGGIRGITAYAPVAITTQEAGAMSAIHKPSGDTE